MKTAREVLNFLKWGLNIDFARVKIDCSDRTLIIGFKNIEGNTIRDVERRYFTTDRGRIPLYKIQKIWLDGNVIWIRKRK